MSFHGNTGVRHHAHFRLPLLPTYVFCYSSISKITLIYFSTPNNIKSCEIIFKKKCIARNVLERQYPFSDIEPYLFKNMFKIIKVIILKIFL